MLLTYVLQLGVVRDKLDLCKQSLSHIGLHLSFQLIHLYHSVLVHEPLGVLILFASVIRHGPPTFIIAQLAQLSILMIFMCE